MSLRCIFDIEVLIGQFIVLFEDFFVVFYYFNIVGKVKYRLIFFGYLMELLMEIVILIVGNRN